MHRSPNFSDWRQNRTPAESELQLLAFKLQDKYFSDLRLQSPSITRKLFRYKSQDDDGQWYDVVDDMPIISIQGWIFKFRCTQKWLGLCDAKHKTIFIKQNLEDVEHLATLLHEIIHAFESQLVFSFREWLVIEPYRRLSRRIKPALLHRYITSSTHALVHNTAHGVLFLLKSIDLDLRLKWKVGTVFGYGREDYLA